MNVPYSGVYRTTSGKSEHKIARYVIHLFNLCMPPRHTSNSPDKQNSKGKRQITSPSPGESASESFQEDPPCSSSTKMPSKRANLTKCPYCKKQINTSSSYSNLNRHMKKCAVHHNTNYLPWTLKTGQSPEVKKAKKKELNVIQLILEPLSERQIYSKKPVLCNNLCQGDTSSWCVKS